MRFMRRHLIVFYTLAIILIISGRYAYTHCEWDWVSRIAAVGVILGIVIERWNVLTGQPAVVQTAPPERLPIILLCAGTFIAGFGELAGRSIFGCS
ncbi:MAG TPA: hypothetical protein VFK15_02825 [Burkholderiales bacterium]|nr:hypothetical protein [Burkholderiales bacterium]